MDNNIKLFTAVSYNFRDKLERLSLAGLSSLVLLFVGEAGAHTSVAQVLHSRVSSGLTESIGLGSKGLPGINTLAYYDKS